MAPQARRYDADRVLTYDDGLRVPSRLGAVEWARDAVTAGTTPVVALAMAIALRIDDSLVCWPGQKRLAADIRGGVRTVGKSLPLLQEMRIVYALYVWEGNACTGCVYAFNAEGWLDDIWDDDKAVLKRVEHVRAEAVRLDLVKSLPAGRYLSVSPPARKR